MKCWQQDIFTLIKKLKKKNYIVHATKKITGGALNITIDRKYIYKSDTAAP